MKSLEALVLEKRLHHNGDPVMAWMVSNVVCHRDAKDNIYPRKERPENKIDGVVALIMALGRAMQMGEQGDLEGFLDAPLNLKA
jgi:phage terminase large subunit-like protein